MGRLVRTNTGTWLILMALTLAGFAVAETGLAGGGAAAGVLLATLIKGRLVVDQFMGLAQVAWRWRALMSGYLLLVVGMIGVAYATAL